MAPIEDSGLRKRAKHTRSKTGCRVCRIRRIRCDERRPDCHNCTSTGRACEGFAPVAERRSPLAVAILPRSSPSTLPDSSSAELRSISFFRHRSAPQFATLFNDGFWTESVLQRGTQEKCVRLAMAALGASHEAFEAQRRPNNSTPDTLKQVAELQKASVESYGKAMKVLNSHIATNRWKGLDVSLICCLMCVAYEWLRGEYRAATMHLTSGLTILRQWAEERGTSGPIVSFSSPAGHFIRANLTPLFTRLTIQARTLDTNRPPPIPWSSAITDASLRRSEEHSVVAARADLDLVLSEIYLRSENFVYAFPDIFMKDGVREYSISRVGRWYQRYQMHIAPPGTDHSALLPLSSEQLSLSLWHTLCDIMLRAGHTTDQQIYDHFLPCFRHMITLAELLVKSLAKSIKTATYVLSKFQVDIEQIPMLYFVGSRCRHPAVRRQALSLLRIDTGREGLWDGAAQVRLLEEVIAIEEEGIEDVVDESSIPGARRIYAVAEERDLDKRRMEVRFFKQGDGCFGPVQVLKW